MGNDAGIIKFNITYLSYTQFFIPCVKYFVLSMVVPYGFCSLDLVLLVLASWIFFWIAKPVANLLFDFLEFESLFGTHMDEVIVALLRNFLQITRASVFRNAVLDLKVSVNGFCIADYFIYAKISYKARSSNLCGKLLQIQTRRRRLEW